MVMVAAARAATPPVLLLLLLLLAIPAARPILLRGGPIDADPAPATGGIDDEEPAEPGPGKATDGDATSTGGEDGSVDPIFGDPVSDAGADKATGERMLAPVTQMNSAKTDDFLNARDRRAAERMKRDQEERAARAADREAAANDPVGHFRVYKSLREVKAATSGLAKGVKKAKTNLVQGVGVPQAIEGMQAAMASMFPPETLLTFQAFHHETTRLTCMLNPDFPPCRASRYSPYYKAHHNGGHHRKKTWS